MAAPGHPAYNTAAFWQGSNVLDLFFPHLTYEEARNLMEAVGVDLALHEYTRCKTFMCDSSSVMITRGSVPVPWRPTPPMHHPTQRPPCGRTAYFMNDGTGHREPSLCLEPHDHPPPGPGMHGSVHPTGTPRVCTQCKIWRADDWEWKMRELKFGVCTTCRQWAIENMEPGQDNCTCPGSERYTNGEQNNEPAYKHLCVTHERRYWALIWNESYKEIRTRLRLVRGKKRGHGWTHRKGQSKVAKTPHERRKGMKPVVFGPTALVVRGPPQQAHPRCYCGNKVTLAELQDTPTTTHPGPANPPAQVRSCVGCNEFVRRW